MENLTLRYALAFALAAVLPGWSAGQVPSGANRPEHANNSQANGKSETRDTIYHSDPQHPWNVLYRLLYSRTTQEGEVYDQESLEPLFLPGSRFLTEGPSHQQTITLLDEFLKGWRDEAIKDPLRRAMLQRDLWAVFSTTVPDAQIVFRGDRQRDQIIYLDRFEDPGDGDIPEEQRPRRRALQMRLVEVMRRIALTPGEIAALPDNLDQGVKAGTFPRMFDPKQPNRSFLPTDLLDPDGSWVPVSNIARAQEGFLAAPEHVRFTKGRSVFTVYLRLPEGRHATEAFVKTTQSGNPPQFPPGTQTALLRRMLLIDSAGTLRLSPVTESLQIRVYGKLDLGIPYGFTLRRGDLFAGRSGGLHALGLDEASYFDFQTRFTDVFEMPKLPPATPVMMTCEHCHARLDGRGGIHTVNTIYARGYAREEKATGLCPTTSSHEAAATIAWVRKSYTWGLLQGMWANTESDNGKRRFLQGQDAPGPAPGAGRQARGVHHY